MHGRGPQGLQVALTLLSLQRCTMRPEARISPLFSWAVTWVISSGFLMFNSFLKFM